MALVMKSGLAVVIRVDGVDVNGSNCFHQICHISKLVLTPVRTGEALGKESTRVRVRCKKQNHVYNLQLFGMAGKWGVKQSENS